MGCTMKKRKKPIMKAVLEKYKGEFTVENSEIMISYSEISNTHLNKRKGVKFLFDTVVFRNVEMQENKLERSEFIDCIFYNCNLSNNYFDSTSFIRCEFYDSKLDGSHFVDSYLEHIYFMNVLGKYLDITQCKIKFFEVTKSALEESSWFTNKIQNLFFSDSSLVKAEFYQTLLSDVDLSSSNIEGMKIDLNGLRGSTISTDQAVLLMGLIGVHIKE